MTAFLAGFLLSASLILAIGAQNAFVLRQGLKGWYVGPVVAVCITSEAVLIGAGVAGFGALSEVYPAAERLIRWAGAAFLVVYGLRSLLSAFGPDQVLAAAEEGGETLRAAILTSIALTWLNPHVYLDTVVFLGSVAAQYGAMNWVFGAGALSASAVFFLALGYGARALQPLFRSPLAWRILDLAMAALMLALAYFLLTA